MKYPFSCSNAGHTFKTFEGAVRTPLLHAHFSGDLGDCFAVHSHPPQVHFTFYYYFEWQSRELLSHRMHMKGLTQLKLQLERHEV